MKTTTEDIHAVKQAVDPTEVLQLSRELVRIPSIYRHEHRISQFIFKKLEGWGFSPRFVNVEGYGPDVVAEIGAKDLPSLVLNGHIDTVDVVEGWSRDPFGAEVRAGMLHGLGALDMKCGLAELMVAFRTLAEMKATPGLRISFQAVSGEEHTGAGTATLIAKGHFKRAKAVIIGEGFGGLRVVANARRGGSYVNFEVIGKSAHGAMPEKGINAVTDASRLVCALSEMKMRKAPELTGDDFKPLKESQTILKINGGTDSLSVPDKCSFKLVRSTLPGKEGLVMPEIREVVRSLRRKSKVKMVLETGLDLYHPYLTPPSSKLVTAAMDAVRLVVGRRPRLVTGLSEADDNVIAFELGLPVICVGPGETGALAKYHQANEAISISQLGDAAKVYALTAMSLA